MRRAALAAGLALLALIWFGPLLSQWRESFAAHMFAHMGVVAVAAPLLAFGLVPRLPPFASAGARPVLLSLPVLASLAELVVVWLWHAPVMRALAETSLAATVVEQASFLAAGLFLWLACLADRGLTGALALLLTSIHMTLLGVLLALSPRPLYGPGDVICFGTTLSAAGDQQIGGVVMLAVGALVYLFGGVALAARALKLDPVTRPGAGR